MHCCSLVHFTPRFPFPPCQVCLCLCVIAWVHVNFCVMWKAAVFIFCLCVWWGANKRQCPCSPCLRCTRALNTLLPASVFYKKKKENSQGRNLILARHFLEFTSRKSKGENTLLSRKACVCIWWSWCLWPLRLVVTVAGGDGNNAVLTFARVGICQCCVTTVELPLLGWLISVSLGSRF